MFLAGSESPLRFRGLNKVCMRVTVLPQELVTVGQRAIRSRGDPGAMVVCCCLGSPGALLCMLRERRWRGCLFPPGGGARDVWIGAVTPTRKSTRRTEKQRTKTTPRRWSKRVQVMGLTEFTGIDTNGNEEERQRTYSQSTTTGTQNWYWTDDTLDFEFALMMVDMSIPKFEYTAIVVSEQTKQ